MGPLPDKQKNPLQMSIRCSISVSVWNVWFSQKPSRDLTESPVEKYLLHLLVGNNIYNFHTRSFPQAHLNSCGAFWNPPSSFWTLAVPIQVATELSQGKSWRRVLNGIEWQTITHFVVCSSELWANVAAQTWGLVLIMRDPHDLSRFWCITGGSCCVAKCVCAHLTFKWNQAWNSCSFQPHFVFLCVCVNYFI